MRQPRKPTHPDELAQILDPHERADFQVKGTAAVPALLIHIHAVLVIRVLRMGLRVHSRVKECHEHTLSRLAITVSRLGEDEHAEMYHLPNLRQQAHNKLDTFCKTPLHTSSLKTGSVMVAWPACLSPGATKPWGTPAS